MLDEFIKKLAEYRQANEPFATALVVRRQAPSSGKAGDKALINKYGEIFGWIGGGCTKAIIVSEAEKAMRDGKARLVRVSPEAQAGDTEGIVAYTMTCHSGGAVDVYIEPVLPKPQLLVMGKSAIAQALVKLGKAIDYRVTALAPGAAPDTFPGVDALHTQLNLDGLRFQPHSFLVVATQGEQDEEALIEALKDERPYVAFVSSRKKRDAVFEYLRAAGVPDKRLSKVHSPAGLDIGARLPEEVAVSILAEIIHTLRTAQSEFTDYQSERAGADKPRMYVNPVCGIPVDPLTAKHVIRYLEENVYFCCDGCKIAFEQEPEKYLARALP
jgi:xanthine dehydrogenase accessory factor